jgi:hypothetical protein
VTYDNQPLGDFMPRADQTPSRIFSIADSIVRALYLKPSMLKKISARRRATSREARDLIATEQLWKRPQYLQVADAGGQTRKALKPIRKLPISTLPIHRFG